MISLLYRAADAVRRRIYSSDHGRLGEDLAYRYLRSRGCTVVARNYRTRSGTGELDLVAWHGPVLVFVEVKARSTGEFGSPDRAVDTEKREHVRRAARDYARRAGVEFRNTRFDVVSVILESPPQIEWLQDAFR